MTLLSIGCNSKLGKKVGVFNLPRLKTCPGASDLCKKICYAAKSERMYKAAFAKRQANFLATKDPGFSAAMIAEITGKKLAYVRWHESGDVYNAAYQAKIFEVCNALPQVKFLMYTKSFHLNWDNKPDNLKVYWSIDSTTKGPVPAGVTAYIVQKGEVYSTGAVTCSHTSDKHYCATECLTCWFGINDVYFPQH